MKNGIFDIICAAPSVANVSSVSKPPIDNCSLTHCNGLKLHINYRKKVSDWQENYAVCPGKKLLLSTGHLIKNRTDFDGTKNGIGCPEARSFLEKNV